MVKVKVLRYDVKSKKEEIVEEDMELPPVTPITGGINLEDIKALIEYAKKMGWIK